MKKLIIIIVGLPVLFYTLLGLYFFVIPFVFHSSIIPSATLHYKLTLVVDNNGKQVTGSSIVEVSRQDTAKYFGSFGGYGYDFKGEATVVDLLEKGVLFALLKDNNSGVGLPPYFIIHAFPSYFSGLGSSNVVNEMRELNNVRPRAKTDLAFDKIPMLVRFRDINDPKTVELVDPNDLEKTFGKGVKLVSATIEMTDEGVTSGKTKQYLSWFNKWKNRGGNIMEKEYFEPNLPPLPPETFLIPMNFMQGE